MKQDEEDVVNRKKQKDTMADWAILGALPLGNQRILKRYKVARDNRLLFNSTLETLLDKGCERRALITALCMANTIVVEPFPNTTRVKSLAKKMRDLAGEISKVEDTHFLVWQSQKITKQSGLGPEDVDDLSLAFPYFRLPKWLRRRAEMYEDWLIMAQQKVPPRTELLSRVRHVCPVLYVKWATGRPFYEKVTRLLHLAGIADISVAQLQREVRAFESDYRLAAGQIRGTMKMVHEHTLTYVAQ